MKSSIFAVSLILLVWMHSAANDLAAKKPELVDRAMNMLSEWQAEMMRTAVHPQDPLWTVMKEGGPLHTRANLPEYLRRLRKTGRGEWADLLTARHLGGATQ